MLTITGGSGAVIGGGTSIQVKQATTSVSGFLSSTDWTTFNNKQATITLTTTGTSGNATFSSNTLNIPNYGSALSGYLPLTGGTLTGALGGTSATFSANGSSFGSASVGSYPLTIQTNTSEQSIKFIGKNNNNNVQFFDSAGTTYQAVVGTIGNDFIIGTGTSGTTRLTIASTGAATFSSSVGVGGTATGTYGTLSVFGGISTKNDNNGKLEIGRYSVANPYSYIKLGANSDSLRITNNTDIADIFTLTNAGAATFSSSVTANTTVLVTSADTHGTNVNIINTSTGGYNWNIFSGGSSGTLAPVGSLIFRDSNNGITRMVIAPSGNVGIGTSSPSNKLDVIVASSNSGVSTSGIAISDGAANRTLMFLGVNTAGYTYIQSNQDNVSSRPLALNASGGNILMGTTTDNGEKLYVSGAIRATGSITANSDISLKKNLLKIENALQKVEQINGYTYEFKEDDSKRHAGVIAQEIQTVLPEIVNKGNDGILGVEYGNISALLIEAIKEQQTQIKQLKALLNK